MIKIRQKGNFSSTEGYLKRILRSDYKRFLHQAGKDGVAALSAASPVGSGATASSWSYEIEYKAGSAKVIWYNNHTTAQGTPIAILIQYGHATGTGGYVQGRDFINPALKPVVDRLSEQIFLEVSR